ncbi:MAG: hypothetical protein Q8L05_11645 [Actinomycetota bacterium]|nr:hypothetical protein [Actinomycetota bacterium]MDP2289198.1 hypothetical protein [Actinomycetota bacterium]
MTCPNGHEAPYASAFCPACGAAMPNAGHQQYPTATPQASAAPLPVPTTWPAAGVAAPNQGSYPVAPGNYLPAQVGGSIAPRNMYLIAAIINWVVLGFIILVTLGFGIICAAWFIPMTIQMHKGVRSPYKHTSLGVCALLFCNLVSGILILADDSGKPPKPL